MIIKPTPLTKRYFRYSILVHGILLMVFSFNLTRETSPTLTLKQSYTANMPNLQATLTDDASVIHNVPFRPNKPKLLFNPVQLNHRTTSHTLSNLPIRYKRDTIKSHAKILVKSKHPILPKTHRQNNHKALTRHRLNHIHRLPHLTQLQKQADNALNQSLQQQINKEQQMLTEMHNEQMNRLLNQYKAQIIQAISHRWLVPKGVDTDLHCQLLIDVAPGGGVLDAHVVQSSGDRELDRSAILAVRKASPLPVPKDPTLFNKFRQLLLTVSPEDIS